MAHGRDEWTVRASGVIQVSTTRTAYVVERAAWTAPSARSSPPGTLTWSTRHGRRVSGQARPLYEARGQPRADRQVAAWDLDAYPAAAAGTRSSVARQLTAWGLEELDFTAELLVSELVTDRVADLLGQPLEDVGQEQEQEQEQKQEQNQEGRSAGPRRPRAP